MQGLTESKQTDIPMPVPQTLGLFTLIIMMTAFTAGNIKNELGLIFVGTLFFAVLCYCFVSIFILAVILKKQVYSSEFRMLTKHIRVGDTAECTFSVDNHNIHKKKRFIRIPGILIRYEIMLSTRDHRRIVHIFDPDHLKDGVSLFPVYERGAYYSQYDEFAIFDILGFFRLSFNIPRDKSPCILAYPKIAEETISFTLQTSGEVHKKDGRFLRTDEFTDYRPYTPGDDPRRINWKLYGHFGELFVREGELESPPYSRLLMIVDTQTDFSLYTREEGKAAVDFLCENALALALEYMNRGVCVSIGYTGGEIYSGTQAEIEAALAYPAALSLYGTEDYPFPQEDQGILILALPRLNTETSALDRFLKKRSANQSVDILFIYDRDSAQAAEDCVKTYRQSAKIHAGCIRVAN